MLTAGVDIGARSIDIVLFDGKGITASRVLSSGMNPRVAAEEAFTELLDSENLEADGLDNIIATGYGRNNFKRAGKAMPEVICHAVGVAHFFPDAELVVDIGGQDSKVIHMDPGGVVKNFAMNDRCAAGTGKFIEIVSQTLGIPVEESGALALTAKDTVEISSMCAVFAESEIVGLTQNGVPPETILRGVFRSVARRTVSLMGRSSKAEKIIFTGGVAWNSGVAEAIREVSAKEVLVPDEPQLTGALGAAILAAR